MIGWQQSPAVSVTGDYLVAGALGCLFLLNAVSGECSQLEDRAVPFIEETELPFPELLEEISEGTGYEIELVGNWPRTPVNTKVQGMTLEAGLKRIIKELGSIDYALISDPALRKIKIVRLQEGVGPDRRAISDYTSLPSGDGAYSGDSEAQQQDKRPGDTEISPPSEFGPGLTIDEVDEIKRRSALAIESEGNATVVSPASEYGGAITAGQLNTIKALYESRSKSQAPGSIVSPPSSSGPGMTLGDLNSIKQRHAATPLSDATLVAPPSEYGPGLTMGEVEAIKAGARRKTGNSERQDVANEH